MSSQRFPTVERGGWSVETFRAFWSDPENALALVPSAPADDVVGHWPGLDEPVRGKEDYAQCIEALVHALPGMHLSVAEHAQSGEFVFVRWIMHAIAEHGAFELSGIDRVRVRGGKVTENVIVFDTAAF